MISLIAINPFSSRFKTIDESKILNPNFYSLSKIDQRIILIATAIVACLTFDILSKSYFLLLAKRFTYMHEVKETKFSSKNIMYVDESLEQVKPIAEIPKTQENQKPTQSKSVDASVEQVKLVAKLQKTQEIQQPNQSKSVYASVPFEGRYMLNIHQTCGDGSCGFHAILGQNNSGSIVKIDNVAKKRTEFCDWLKECHVQKKLPAEIETLIMGYCIEFDKKVDGNYVVPSKFRQLARATHKRIINETDKLTFAEIDKKRMEFIYDSKVMDAYIENMKSTRTYVGQDELKVAAEFFNLRLFLFQQDWNNDGSLTCNRLNELRDPNFKPQPNDVFVYFSGAHYEKVEVQEQLYLN